MLDIFVILKRPSYIWLPVNLAELWYDDAALYTLESVSTALSDPKCFVISLFLSLTSFITLIESFTASVTVLTELVHTAHHVNTLSCNVNLALFT